MDLERLWGRDWQFEIGRDEPKRCSFAERFHEWADELCAHASDRDNTVFINQAKILLIDKYFEWRSVVPKSHRTRLGGSGHICIFQVFADAYERLKAMELSLTPPMLFLPPTPAPAPQPQLLAPAQIAGIFIGEDES